METLCDLLTVHFFKVQNICSRTDFPLSLFVVLVQGLRNDLNRSLNHNSGEFSRVLGRGAGQEVAAMITSRFNMDGLDPIVVERLACLTAIIYGVSWLIHTIISCGLPSFLRPRSQLS